MFVNQVCLVVVTGLNQGRDSKELGDMFVPERRIASNNNTFYG